AHGTPPSEVLVVDVQAGDCASTVSVVDGTSSRLPATSRSPVSGPAATRFGSSQAMSKSSTVTPAAPVIFTRTEPVVVSPGSVFGKTIAFPIGNDTAGFVLVIVAVEFESDSDPWLRSVTVSVPIS